MNNLFKRFVVMTFLCCIGIFFAQNDDMAVRQSSNVDVMNTQDASYLDLNSFNLEEEQLIQKCLTFQPLQDNIPANVKTQMNHFHILNSDVNLLISLDFEIEGKSVLLINDTEIDSQKPYFLFNTLNIENDKALVEYDFVFTDSDTVITESVTVEFEKKGLQWKEFNYYIETKG